MSGSAPKILLIRRDNIGDLACTTPLIDALRVRFPAARLCALVTAYNRAVLDHHPGLDAVYAYTKAKHRAHGQSALATYVDRLRLLLDLRRQRFDYAVLAAPGVQKRALGLARLIRPRHIVGFVEVDRPPPPAIDRGVPWRYREQAETTDVWDILRAFDIAGEPGPLRVVPDPQRLAALRPRFTALRAGGRRLTGIHLSARKPSQRWPVERFADLARQLHDRTGNALVILWAPGRADNPQHPGDDEKAAALLAQLGGLPVLPLATGHLAELIAATALCDDFVCADGGAMHLAAGSGRPIVCLFGLSDPVRWRPWGVPHRLLQAPSRQVDAIGVDAVIEAYLDLRAELEAAGP